MNWVKYGKDDNCMDNIHVQSLVGLYTRLDRVRQLLCRILGCEMGWRTLGQREAPSNIWLETLRIQAGQKRYVLFRWPKERKQISRSLCFGKGLRFLGDGDSIPFPPSCDESGIRHFYLNPQPAVAPAPHWLIDLIFKPESDVDSSQSLPSDGTGLGRLPHPFEVNHEHCYENVLGARNGAKAQMQPSPRGWTRGAAHATEAATRQCTL